jgi:hypothetical protein
MSDASGEGAGPVEVLDLRTFNWPLTLFSLVVFAVATLFWISHALGGEGATLVLACLLGGVGVIAFLYSLLPLSLRADEAGLEWRQAGSKRSLKWSEIEGFGVWRDPTVDEWNAHPVVRLTRSQRYRPPAQLMIRLTPEAQKARNTYGRFTASGYDIGLILPVRMSLTLLEGELEKRLAVARRGLLTPVSTPSAV